MAAGARAELGPPHWLRSRRQMPRITASTNVPVVFPLVKSKCCLPNGAKCCCKPNHSCMRRAVDASNALGTYGYRSLGRAAR
eukprot:665907-Pyramimonas_sp.AAC.1